MSGRREFGAALRSERQRRGIPLEVVADRTKIGMALLAGLERGDLQRWPTGIFRRAFVRAYAEAIGLDPAEVLTAFERVWPDQDEDGVVSVPPFGRPSSPGSELRLQLASRPKLTGRTLARRVTAVVADAAAVALAGGLAAFVSGWPFPVVTLGVGALYFALGTLLLECSFATWAWRRLGRARAVVPMPSPSRADVPVSLVERVAPDVPRGEAAARPSRRDRRVARGDRTRVSRPAQRLQ